LEWITDLHGGPIFARLLRQFARRESRTCKTITAGFGADIKHRIACAFRSAARELFVAQHAEAKNVYQWIALEAFIEINIAANCRNPHAVPVKIGRASCRERV